MWTKKNRRRYERRGLRYESDLTDEEYALIEQFLPAERSISRRSLVNGILYILTTGCQWRQLPKDFPPKARRMTTLSSCIAPVYLQKSIMHSMPPCANWRARTQHRASQSSVAKP